jgi:hypoxanthine phosphoribosyltransferase
MLGAIMKNDIERILIRQSEIMSRLDEIAALITEDYRGRKLTVITVLNGALMMTSDLLRRIPLPLKLDCISVASYHGGAETTGCVTFDQISMPEVSGRDVLIIDDILDSGLTLAAIRERLQKEMHARSIRICVLLRKKRERLAQIEPEYVGFDIEDEFVVGYGLDYQERYRNLPFIGVLRPACIEN